MNKDAYVLIEAAMSSCGRMFIYLNSVMWIIEEEINLGITH